MLEVVLTSLMPGGGQLVCGRSGTGWFHFGFTVCFYLLCWPIGLAFHLFSLAEATSWYSDRH